MKDFNYENNWWDKGWLTLGIGVGVYGLFIASFGLLVFAFPVILLSHKSIMQNKLIQSLEDEIDDIYNPKPSEELPYDCLGSYVELYKPSSSRAE